MIAHECSPTTAKLKALPVSPVLKLKRSPHSFIISTATDDVYPNRYGSPVANPHPKLVGLSGLSIADSIPLNPELLRTDPDISVFVEYIPALENQPTVIISHPPPSPAYSVSCPINVGIPLFVGEFPSPSCPAPFSPQDQSS